MSNTPPASFLFVSCNEAHWGGSEELWTRTALELAERGFRITVAKPNISPDASVLRRLRERGASLHDLANIPWVPKWLQRKMQILSRNLSRGWQLLRLSIVLLITRPDFIVLNQGGNWDGFLYAALLRRLGRHYVLVSHKATELYWPADWMRAYCKQLYEGARRIYFVSERNRRLTELQLGMSLCDASIVRNPFLTDWHSPLPWPSEDGTLHLACVARFHPSEKGQDLLLNVLSLPKWRERNFMVSFFGDGDCAAAVREMAVMLGLTNVTFPGFTDDIAAIWSRHHALILPSRAEGLPLVVVEAMLAGRVPIVTDVGGNRELCIDGVNAFVAPTPTVAAINATLERAWDARNRWREMGEAASRHARRVVPQDPAAVFADELLDPARQVAEERVFESMAAE